MAALYRRYEAALERAGLIDFEDMLARTIELIETDDAAASEVRDRYRWFSVDEFQDTNPLQAGLLDAWLGGREDLAVVGDEDQTIFTFTGATSDYLTGFRASYPAAREVTLETNYRSTPSANCEPRVGRAGRLEERPAGAAAAKRLAATVGPAPIGVREREGRDRSRTGFAREGTPHGRWRPVRTNRLPPSRVLGAAGSPTSGVRVFARPEVRRAVATTLAGSAKAHWSQVGAASSGVGRQSHGDDGAWRARPVRALELAEDLVRSPPGRGGDG
jgi:hypothetical protein